MQVNVNDVVNHVSKSLYGMEETSKALSFAWNAKQNITLYGSGGYGKSQIAMIFAKYLEDNGHITTKPFVMSFGRGMTEDKLFGGMDIKSFQDQGVIEYLLGKSFIEHELVIFEEMFDAYPEVLLILKDVLTSGYVRQGSNMVPIKTKMIIGCTNRTREEVVTDLSTAALLERFQFEQWVGWSSYQFDDYLSVMKCNPNFAAFEYSAHLVCHVCSQAAKDKGKDIKISPRSAMYAFDAMVANNEEPHVLNYLPNMKEYLPRALEQVSIFGVNRVIGAANKLMEDLHRQFKKMTPGTGYADFAEQCIVDTLWLFRTVAEKGGISGYKDEAFLVYKNLDNIAQKVLPDYIEAIASGIVEENLLPGSKEWAIKKFKVNNIQGLLKGKPGVIDQFNPNTIPAYSSLVAKVVEDIKKMKYK
jgi:MoxR domain in the MoxR-vWA-beta-propeller ternary systems